MVTVYLALGSNLGERQAYMQRAVQEMAALGCTERIAPLYESAPYGERAQPAFLNSALGLATSLTPQALLNGLKTIEQKLGRKARRRWGPREIDLDIIFFGQEMVQEAGLTIPHYDYRRRRFVLQPLADIAPDFIAPDTRLPLWRLLADCPDTTPLKPLQNNWMTDDAQL